MQKKSWNELKLWQQAAIIKLAVIEIGLFVAAWRDLSGRSREQINGNKQMWRAAKPGIMINKLKNDPSSSSSTCTTRCEKNLRARKGKMMTYTIPFSELNKTNIPTAGGKGANLGEMTTAGFPVPAGFVLTTAAYDAFVAAHGLQAQIVELARTVVADDPQSSESASEKIKQLFLRVELSAEIACEYGLPCVSGVERAVLNIPDGALIEVEGSNGIVRLVDAV